MRKANPNVWILNILMNEGAWADVVSPGEIHLALKAGFPPKRLLFTENSVSDDEMRYALSKGVLINVESLSQLERLGRMAPGTDISVRFNIYVGAGHHSHVITGGTESKFGIDWDRAQEVRSRAQESNLRVRGVHCHIGSGILDAGKFVDAVQNLLSTAATFEGLEFIDFGGGIGVPYRDEESEIDLPTLGEQLLDQYRSFCTSYGEKPALALEPGRFLVAQAGTLLCTVTCVKKGRKYRFVGTNTGFNHLVRPAFYGSYHRIDPVEPRDGKTEPVVVTGNLCESGDVFTRNEEGILPRELPRLVEGDLLAIRNAGAYGFAMASRYNSFPLPAEILVSGKTAKLIRRRETMDDLLRGIPGYGPEEG